MSNIDRTTTPHPIPAPERIRWVAASSYTRLAFTLLSLFIPLSVAPLVLIGVGGVAPTATADQSPTSDLEQADAELLRQFEQAQRLEAEALQREEDRREALARRLEREQRAVADQNAAAREARQQRLQRQIDSEFEFQNEMLERKQRNETATSRNLLGAHAVSDQAARGGRLSPRLAPATPVLRDLPRSIFDEQAVVIPAATPGFENDRKLNLTRLFLDADGDGVPEVVRYLDRKTDALYRQEEDRNYDGTMDTFYRFEGGQLVEREIDRNDDGLTEIRERYLGQRMVARTLDRDDDGVVDAFYEYEGPHLARERHDADNNGEIDLVIEYREGRRFASREDTDRDGRMDTWIRYGLVDGLETVTHIESDKTGRGFADTYETFETREGKAILARREEDLDGDGEIDLVSIYRAGKLVRREILKPEVVPL